MLHGLHNKLDWAMPNRNKKFTMIFLVILLTSGLTQKHDLISRPLVLSNSPHKCLILNHWLILHNIKNYSITSRLVMKNFTLKTA